MQIAFAITDEEIDACYPIMREVRPHVGQKDFTGQIRTLETSGYHLVALRDAGSPVAVAGFRIGSNLSWGRYLYVDDLVTLPDKRSKGYGSTLLDWLRKHAVEMGCQELHLDSGLQRTDAHRFYEREGMLKSGYHFVERLGTSAAV